MNTETNVTSTSAPREDVIADVVEHVRSMQYTYEFQNDADSIAGALSESADLLGIELTPGELALAATRALESGPAHLRHRA